ncbi:MAG: hypothetical protein IPK15_21030 [Verrucomicrobia bacterium]|nr:hypothetical protein [Verrucomicrobiota bacterium]
MAFEPEVSNKPPAIHFLNTASSFSASGGLFGGIVGSSTWVSTLTSLLESGLPETTTGPVPPPFNTPL